ncbi:glycosyltransferase family 2 protein [Salinimicrobium soli]|uniref:glycosyltransferase family 2 protein n=1 Tax=Salinimicrobium soli TaxID=1254399 RepID=UPI003AAFD7F1
MDKQYRLSIITVNLNNLEGLKSTLKSVFEQTWQDFEYIIVDGSSTDGSKEYLDANSDKMDYWISEPDTGIYNAMNKGAKIASGDYLLFLNSGDYFIDRTVLDSAQKYLGDEEIIYFNTEVVEKDDKYIKWTPEILSYNFLKSDSLPHQGTFIKKSAFQLLGGYDETYRIISDWKFTAVGVLKYGFTTKKANLLLSRFFKDGISSKERTLLHSERKLILSKEFREYPEIEELRMFRKNILRSKSIKFLRKLGFLRWIKK